MTHVTPDCLALEWVKKRKHNFENCSFEDLFFLILEAKESKLSLMETQSNNKLILEHLLEGIYHRYNKKRYNLRHDQNALTSFDRTDLDLLECIGLLLESKLKKHLSPTNIYCLDFFGGKEFLKKHGISNQTKSFLTEKFKKYISEKQIQYQSNKGLYCNYGWYGEFLDEIKFLQGKIDAQVFKSFYINEYTSIIEFAAYIEAGFEPKEKEIFTVFNSVWEQSTDNTRNELGFFCESFSKTKIFKNSLANAKNLPLSLKKFFKPYLQGSDNIGDIHRQQLLQDNLQMFFSHPCFLQENIRVKLSQNNLKNSDTINTSNCLLPQDKGFMTDTREEQVKEKNSRANYKI